MTSNAELFDLGGHGLRRMVLQAIPYSICNGRCNGGSP
jgi:hypothetical protein